MDRPGVRTESKPMGDQQVGVRGGALPPGLAQPCGCSPPTPLPPEKPVHTLPCALQPLKQRGRSDTCTKVRALHLRRRRGCLQGRGAEHQEPPDEGLAASPPQGHRQRVLPRERMPQALCYLCSDLRRASLKSIFCKNCRKNMKTSFSNFLNFEYPL